MSTIQMSAKCREENFGYPQADVPTHLKVTPVPTAYSDPNYLPIIDRERGSYWAVQSEGRSGYWWTFSAQCPADLDGKEMDIELAREDEKLGMLPY